ncbi:hypothetical protein HY524_01325 [Candidatus Berkelbacteria bacterium]|nr:hypothetical protein [Candidatus Berkelbacteria bacterium]
MNWRGPESSSYLEYGQSLFDRNEPESRLEIVRETEILAALLHFFQVTARQIEQLAWPSHARWGRVRASLHRVISMTHLSLPVSSESHELLMGDAAVISIYRSQRRTLPVETQDQLRRDEFIESDSLLIFVENSATDTIVHSLRVSAQHIWQVQHHWFLLSVEEGAGACFQQGFGENTADVLNETNPYRTLRQAKVSFPNQALGKTEQWFAGDQQFLVTVTNYLSDLVRLNLLDNISTITYHEIR